MPDAVVVGAGIVGAACARALARAGVSVTVLERGAVAGGTSAHGEGNLLVSDKGPGDELVLAQASLRLWHETAADLSAELDGRLPDLEFDAKGGIVVVTTEAGARPLLDFAAAQRGAGVDARVLDTAALRELEPFVSPEVTAAVHYPEDCQVEPVIATEALLASARLAGAEVRTGCTVTGAVRDGGRIAGVRTSSGDVPAQVVVNAAGPWAGELAALLGAPIPVRPRRGMVLVTSRMPQRIVHKVYDGDYVSAVGSGDAALQTAAVVESTRGGTVLIGSSREQIGFDDRVRPHVLAEIARKALRLFPFLSTTAIMRAYGGFRPFMPDHLPLSGPDPRLPGLYHATGHEGAGIVLSLASAQVLAHHIAGVPCDLDSARFRPDRASLAPYLEELDRG